MKNLQVAGGQLRNPPVHFRRDSIGRSTSIQYVQIEPGMNSGLGNGSFWVEIRDAKHVDQSIHKYINMWIDASEDLYWFDRIN